MPSLRIHRNGEHLCTAGSDDVWTFTASLWGDVFGPEAAVLDVTGRSAPGSDTSSSLLVWECPVALARGDVLEMFFETADESLPAPVVIRRNSIDAGERKLPANRPTDAEIAALASREMLNAGIMFNVRIADRLISIEPDASREQVSLQILWRQRRREYVRVSLSKQSLREIIARADGEELFCAELPLGSRLVVAIAPWPKAFVYARP